MSTVKTRGICACVAFMTALLVLAPMPHLQGSSARPRDAQREASLDQEAPLGTTWYLAEGYTADEFDTWVLVQNPGDQASQVTLEFQLQQGTADPYSFELPPLSRMSIHLDDLPGLAATDVSTKVTSTTPVVAERAMYFDYDGKKGGHESIGVTSAAQAWYLAEGFTGEEFDTWVLVQNPEDGNAQVTLDFQLPQGTADSYSFELPPRTRKSIHLDDLPGLSATDVSTRVTSTTPVVAERAMYFDYGGKEGGHDSCGVTSTALEWYLAEGYTGGEFDTWVLVQNPGLVDDATVTLNFQLPPGSGAEPYAFTLAPGARQSIHLDALPGLESTDVSTRVTSTAPVVAERAMYFDYEGRRDGSNSSGVNTPSTNWNLAEGYTGDQFDTWVLVQNPGDTVEAAVTLQFQLPPGASAEPYSFTLPAGTRQSVHLDDLPGLASTDVSTKVTSTAPVVVERAMYFDYDGKEGGSCSVGDNTLRPTVIPPTTKPLSQSTLARLTSVSGDLSRLEFSQSNAELLSLKPGDVIVTGPAEGLPYGLLRRVTSNSTEGGGVVLGTEFASLTDAVQDCQFDAVYTLYPDEALDMVGGGLNPPRADATSRKEFNYTMPEQILYDGDGNEATRDDQVRLNGGIKFAIQFDFEVDISGFTCHRITFRHTVTESANARLTAETQSCSFSKEVSLFTSNFPNINFWVGPVPVTLVPQLETKAGASGSVSMSMDTSSVVQDATWVGGIEYRDGNWYNLARFDNSFKFTPPALHWQLSARAFIRPELSVLLYGVGGLCGAVEGYLTLDANPSSSPWWKLFGGFKATVGAKLNVRILWWDLSWRHDATVYDNKWLIAQAQDPPTHGQVNGSVKDAVTGQVLSGVTVAMDCHGNAAGTCQAGSDGCYTIVVPQETYTAFFSKPGYMTAEYDNIVVTGGKTTYLQPVLQIDTLHSGPGDAGGTVRSALTGNGVPNVTVNLRSNINNTTGPVVATTTTLGDGTYSFIGLPAGYYTAEMTSADTITTFIQLVCIGGVQTLGQDATVAPLLPDGETMIVLTWGETPADLDAHLTGPGGGDIRFHIYWHNKTYGAEGETEVQLDLDDTTSYGPETATVIRQRGGTYRYSVHDYTNCERTSGSSALSNSGARVRVFKGSEGLMGDYFVPPNREGTLWTVFEMDEFYFYPINSMSYEQHSADVQ